MAVSVLDKYGIKEIADITFYNIDDAGNPTNPVLYIDTAKVFTTELTADMVTAKGGKGNLDLIAWDANKQVNVTLTDALFSAKSMAIMFGNGQVDAQTSATNVIRKTVEYVATSTAHPTQVKYAGPGGVEYTISSPSIYEVNTTSQSAVPSATELVVGTRYFATGYINVYEIQTIEVSGNAFPGTYYCCGDTFARSEVNGKDECFQLVFPKAKITSENTIDLQADGDPTTFSMNLKVLRDANGTMMKLHKYSLDAPQG